VEPNCANSGETEGGGVAAGLTGASLGGVDEAFGVERRGLSCFFSNRTFGAALTAV
jgi:hypothetical protein